jgi:hypothetical protein
MKDTAWLTLPGPVRKFIAQSIQTYLHFYQLVPPIPFYNSFCLYYGLFYGTGNNYECAASSKRMDVEMEDNLEGSRRGVSEVSLCVGGWTDVRK